MSTDEITTRTTGTSEGTRGKFVVAYYLLSVMTGTFFFFFHDRVSLTADVATAVFYLTATALLYSVSRQGNGSDQSKKEEHL